MELESMNQHSAFAMDIRRDTAMQIISQICKVEIIALNSQETTDTICERHCLHPHICSAHSAASLSRNMGPEPF